MSVAAITQIDTVMAVRRCITRSSSESRAVLICGCLRLFSLTSLSEQFCPLGIQSERDSPPLFDFAFTVEPRGRREVDGGLEPIGLDKAGIFQARSDDQVRMR